jgi:hypothetical protein
MIIITPVAARFVLDDNDHYHYDAADADDGIENNCANRMMSAGQFSSGALFRSCHTTGRVKWCVGWKIASFAAQEARQRHLWPCSCARIR